MPEPKLTKAAAEVRKLEAETRMMRAYERRALEEIDRYRRVSSDEDASAAKNRVFTFYGEVGPISVAQCMSALGFWSRRDAGEPIQIVFASPGGSILDGFALHDFIRHLSIAGHKIETVALGFALSMGAVLLQAGDHRVMGRNATLMIHEAHVSLAGEISHLEDSVATIRDFNRRCLGILADRSTMTAKQIERKWKRREWWLTAEEALTFGFVDEIR